MPRRNICPYFTVHVVGPTADRSALLLVYRKYEDDTDYLLCAVREAAQVTPDRCTPFTFPEPMTPGRRIDDPVASVPVPSVAMALRSLDEMGTAQDWRAWLGARFDLQNLTREGRPWMLGKEHAEGKPGRANAE